MDQSAFQLHDSLALDASQSQNLSIAQHAFASNRIVLNIRARLAHDLETSSHFAAATYTTHHSSE